MSNTQHKLDKNRPPRVQITYDVEIGDAQTVKELPLVIGVMGDFTQSEDSLRERKFLNIDKDNFSGIMSSMQPQAEFLVESTLPEKEGNLAVSLTFNTMEDFSPDNIARQVEPLRKLIELREQLCDLRNRAASNERLKEQLSELLQQQNLASSSVTKNQGDEE
ncbi:MAG: type VI secretion system contractile sheath small subunit [Rahnella inusitata]|uniref:Type VI secretion system contractile sheath small subunit n=1 Tax=Rahnella inusitata TaxID=58169 RepID=A0ABX9NYN2_9GAMM|nr:type VI secretion system contractile sheath small subunit [Rahnella inusitata]NMC22930.1 type VI secretion system contractile sheath small subunit [Serratia sp. (in: enterobacteria)]QUT17743.1 type VI secretion system contractile sheath small subunit [Rahnella inusitata]RJT12760.1 type VI secretion system contractile sheath small subunit [Rahnella inusitata]